ncbi:MAG TPA: PfkB family carbohydrate kinase, partial [Candidatus Limnocylindrales bacterium]|nr:PfkB family carbohydrate kinase [Candidatus Limnocylindrales bacterium]
MPGRLVVIGAINVDLEIAGGAHLPQPGETVVGGRFSRHQGGKGGNQAVAAARALRGGPQSGRVSLLGSVGADGNGRAALEALDAEGIDSRHVTLRPDAATGVALIVVARDGANQIAVAPGANAELDPERVGRAVADLLADGGILLASLEVPGPAVAAACRVAHDRGATVVLNPAPVAAGARSVVELADVLTPNELELAALGGSAELRAAHPNLTLVVTLGKDGARIDAPKGETHLPASRVRA